MFKSKGYLGQRTFFLAFLNTLRVGQGVINCGGNEWSEFIFLVEFERISFVDRGQVDSKVRDSEDGVVALEQSCVELSFLVLVDDSASDDEVSIEPSVEQSSTIDLDAKLFFKMLVRSQISLNSYLVKLLRGELANRSKSEVWRVSVSTNQLESGVIGIELTTDSESNESGVVSCEVVFAKLVQGPVVTKE